MKKPDPLVVEGVIGGVLLLLSLVMLIVTA